MAPTRDEWIAKGYRPGKMANCAGCGATIEWFATPAGKSTPMEPAKEGGVGLEPHWANCPKAKEFRKRAWNQLPKTK